MLNMMHLVLMLTRFRDFKCLCVNSDYIGIIDALKHTDIHKRMLISNDYLIQEIAINEKELDIDSYGSMTAKECWERARHCNRNNHDKGEMYYLYAGMIIAYFNHFQADSFYLTKIVKLALDAADAFRLGDVQETGNEMGAEVEEWLEIAGIIPFKNTLIRCE